MTPANSLSLSRILLTFLFMIFLFRENLLSRALALLTFCIASLTDVYDGRIARRREEVSDFGKLIDPIADKILILAAFLAFVELQLVPAGLVILILARELLVTGVRLFALSKGKVLATTRGGKHKTVTQTAAVLWILLVLLAEGSGSKAPFLLESIFWVTAFAAWVTVSSGVLYLFRNRFLFHA